MTLLPHIREVGLMAGTYFAYMYTRKLVFSDVEGVAFSNARRIVDLERSLGFFWEPHWQQWTLDSVRGAVIFFNWAYIMTFWPIVITTAVITYSLDRSRYFYFRNVVLLTFAFALIVFMLFPLAPPRMLPAYFVDTIDQLGPSFYASREAANYYNAFAAMPSLHFTWTAVLGVMFFRLGPSLLKVLGVAYPTMTLLAITITGNHYIVDAVVGAVIAAVSIVAVHYSYRWRDRRRARRLGLDTAGGSAVVRSAAAPAGGGSTSGPASASSSTRPKYCSPFYGGCATSLGSELSRSFCSSAAMRSRARPFVAGKHGSHCCWRDGSTPADAARRAGPGTSTRPT